MAEHADGADGYRPNVGIMLLNGSGRVFVGRRVRKRGSEVLEHIWQMPQGGVDPGEDLLVAAKRELFEETNIRSVERLAETEGWIRYDIPSEIAGSTWRGRYRGQKQKWFAFRFTGAESEIDVARPAGGAHKPEFDAWRWAAIDELTALVVPFKRHVYEAVVETFAPLARGMAG